jgi:hypothetical protein
LDTNKNTIFVGKKLWIKIKLYLFE